MPQVFDLSEGEVVQPQSFDLSEGELVEAPSPSLANAAFDIANAGIGLYGAYQAGKKEYRDPSFPLNESPPQPSLGSYGPTRYVDTPQAPQQHSGFDSSKLDPKYQQAFDEMGKQASRDAILGNETQAPDPIDLPPWAKGVKQEQPHRIDTLTMQKMADELVSAAPTPNEKSPIKIEDIAPEHRATFLRMVYETAQEKGTRKHSGAVTGFGVPLLPDFAARFIDKAPREAGRSLMDVGSSAARFTEHTVDYILGREIASPEITSFAQDVRGALEAGDNPTIGEPWWVKFPLQAIPSGVQMGAALLGGKGLGSLLKAGGVGEATAGALGGASQAAKLEGITNAAQGVFYATQIAPREIEAIRAAGADSKTAIMAGMASGLVQAAIELTEINPFGKLSGGTRGLREYLTGFAKRYGKEIGVEEFSQGFAGALIKDAATNGVDLPKAFIEGLKSVKDAAGPGLFLVGAGAPIQLPLAAVESIQDRGLKLSKWYDTWKFTPEDKARIANNPSRGTTKWLEKLGAVQANEYTRYADRKKLADAVSEENAAMLAELGHTPDQIAAMDDVEAFRIVDEATKPAATPQQQTEPPSPQATNPQDPTANQADDTVIPTDDGEPHVTAESMAEELTQAYIEKNTPPPQEGQPQETPDHNQYVSIKNKYTTFLREMLELTPLSGPQRREWVTAMKDATTLGFMEDGGVAKAVSMATEAIYKPTLWTDAETAGVTMALNTAVIEWSRLSDALQKTTDPVMQTQIARQLRDTKSHIDQITRGTQKAGTAQGQAFAARKIALKQDYSLAAVQSRAAASKGESITDAEMAEFQKAIKERDATIAALNKQLERSKKKQASATLKATAKARKKMSEANRDLTMEQLYAKANELFKGC